MCALENGRMIGRGRDLLVAKMFEQAQACPIIELDYVRREQGL